MDDQLKSEYLISYAIIIKRKEESRFKGFNLFNKKEIEKATKHINDKMDEYAEEFYSNKKQKDDDLSL